MKTVDKANNGLPSFETEWPNNAQAEEKPRWAEMNWAAERLQHMVRTTSLDNTWRGFRGYDSPLAG